MDKYYYNINCFHKAIFFGPGHGNNQGRPRTSLCKLAAQSRGLLSSSGIYESVDEDICKRNWKDVTCKECKEIAGVDNE